MNKKHILTDAEKAAHKALIKEVAAKLSTRETLFPEAVARAKALVRSINASLAKAKTKNP